MRNLELFSDIRLNAIKNSTFFQNETKTVTIPLWLQTLPEKLLNLTSQTEIIRDEISANINKKDSPIYLLTFILSLLTIIILLLLLLLLCFWFCWRRLMLIKKYKKSKLKRVECKDEQLRNITNINVNTQSTKDIETSSCKEVERKVEKEFEEKIYYDKYEKPPRSGIHTRLPSDNYFPEKVYGRCSQLEKKDNNICEKYGYDRFEKKKTYHSPFEKKNSNKIVKELYCPVSLVDDEQRSKIDKKKEINYSMENDIIETRSYEIGRC
uniref:PIR Superfamily Protein n=1 Tax=Strongyloides stercoralis TaxID=6248 RepID=A0A0K0DZJ1_STRER